jgi:hypothetical protein
MKLVHVLPLLLVLGACDSILSKRQTDEWCDESHPCNDPSRYCDLIGKYPISGGLHNICIPHPGDVPCGDAGLCAPDVPICRAGTCGPCSADVQCLAWPTLPICRVSDGACVQCLRPGDCSASTGTPFCDLASGVCRGCQTDAECPELCDETIGQCVAQERILYVDGSVATSGDCSKAAPCQTIGSAVSRLDATHNFIKVLAGTYGESVTLDGVTVTIAGVSTNTMDGTSTTSVIPTLTSNAPGFHVIGTAEVTIRNLRAALATGGLNACGVRCDGSGASATKVTLVQVTLEGNGAQGVYAANCTLMLDRSMVARNMNGGLKVIDSDFLITNNFIVENGASSSAIGGVSIQNDPPDGMAAGRFLFNTVAGNNTSPGNPGGVACSGQSTPLTFSDSIVANNNSQTGNQTLGCNWSYSDIYPSSMTGGGNINLDPVFANMASGNYHVSAGSPASPCIDAADPNATIKFDWDGDHRPSHGRADMGADEVP